MIFFTNGSMSSVFVVWFKLLFDDSLLFSSKYLHIIKILRPLLFCGFESNLRERSH